MVEICFWRAPQTTSERNEENQGYVVTVKPQGRMWLISSACTSMPQLQMAAIISGWVLLKHESKSVINPRLWGHYLSYGVVRPNVTAVTKRTQSSSTASVLKGYNQSVFSEWEDSPTLLLNWLAIGKLFACQTLHKVNKVGSNHDQNKIDFVSSLISKGWKANFGLTAASLKPAKPLHLLKFDAFLSVKCQYKLPF